MSIDLGAGLPPGTRTKVTFRKIKKKKIIKKIIKKFFKNFFLADLYRMVARFLPNQAKNDFGLFKRRAQEETRRMPSRMAIDRSIRA